MVVNAGLPAVVCNVLSNGYLFAATCWSPIVFGIPMRMWSRHQTKSIEASVRAQLGV